MVEGDTMKCHKQKIKPALCFGAGLLVATLLPPKWTLVAATVALIIVSISCMRR